MANRLGFGDLGNGGTYCLTFVEPEIMCKKNLGYWEFLREVFSDYPQEGDSNQKLGYSWRFFLGAKSKLTKLNYFAIKKIKSFIQFMVQL